MLSKYLSLKTRRDGILHSGNQEDIGLMFE